MSVGVDFSLFCLLLLAILDSLSLSLLLVKKFVIWLVVNFCHFGKPVEAIFPGSTEELIGCHPGIGVSCNDKFLVEPASTIKCNSRIHPG